MLALSLSIDSLGVQYPNTVETYESSVHVPDGKYETWNVHVTDHTDSL